VRRQRPVAGRGGCLDRLREYGLCPAEVADPLDGAHVRDEVDAERIGRGQQGDRTGDEVDAGVRVATEEGAAARRAEQLGGAPS
jgi:hypothetical protein